MHHLKIHDNVLYLTLLLVGGRIVQADTVFGFEQIPPSTAVPFSETINGLSANFGGQASVCNSFGQFQSLSGNVLIQNFCGPASELGPLSVAFSSNLSKITFDFATPGGAGMLTLSAFENSTAVGSVSFPSSLPPGFINGEGLASFRGTFNSFTLTSDMPLAIDNLAAQTLSVATPEPTALGFMLIGLGLLAAVFRRSSGESPREYRIRSVITGFCLLAIVFAAPGSAATLPPHPREFTIVSPQFGSSQSGQVGVVLRYITQNEHPKVGVELNGHTINEERFSRSCNGASCTVIGKLTVWDGLRVGENQLSATLAGRLHRPTSETSFSTPVLLESTRFDFAQGLKSSGSTGNTISYYTPISIGLSTIPGGGGSAGTPWLQLTSGYPADFNAIADAWAFPTPPGSSGIVTIPYADLSGGFLCGANTFQAYVLGRQNPFLGGKDDDHVETGACFNTVSDLQSFFQTKMGRPLGSQDLVILGTIPGQTVPPGFDSSALGGTNYSQTPASVYPQAYVMIGVPGASAGSAYESFSIPSAANRPSTPYQPALNGTLMQDQTGNYNFVASGDTNFTVHSDSNEGSYITVGNTTYMPPFSSGNNFWLLVLDQETLAPVNYYGYADHSVNCDASTSTCGATYSVAPEDGGNRLANELNLLANSHNLIFLVSQSCPIQNPGQMDLALGDVLHSIGAAPYAVNSISSGSSCNYSLVTVNDNHHWNPLNDRLALSTGLFSSNGQYGSIQGFLARNQQGLYDVAGKAQMLPNSDGSGLGSSIDYTFETVSSGQRQDWPLVDTAFPVEAYADLSYQILTALGKTGQRLYDVRYFYTSTSFLTNSQLGSIIQTNLGTATVIASNPFVQKSWDNATPAQFAAARVQLGSELQEALSAYGYLGESGIGSYLAGSDWTIYADMIGMASIISKDYSAASNANANARLSKVLNLSGSVIGLFSPTPVIGPILGVVGGALRIGSGAVALGSTPPSPEAVFDDSLANFTKDAGIYTTNLTKGYNGAVNNVLSDGGKLSTISALTSNTGSNWNIPSQYSPAQLQTALTSGAAGSIWLDVLPQLFGIRQFLGGPSPNPGDYGFYDGQCYNLYGGAATASYGAYTTVASDSKLYDLYVFAESPTGSNKDKTVSSTLADLLTTSGQQTIGGNEQNNLNFPSMLLYGYSNMAYSPFLDPIGSGDAVYCYAK